MTHLQEGEWKGRKKGREEEKEETGRDKEWGRNRGRGRIEIIWFCLSSCPLFSFHLLASGSGCKQGNLGNVVYRVQRVPGKCSLQDLLVEQVGEKETEDLRTIG